MVRGTTRRPERLSEIEASGAEPVRADPDRLGTLVGALDHVSVAVLLLGSAVGDRESLAALHGPRLEALLVKLLDTTIRGVVYEASGSVPAPLLAQGAASVERHCLSSHVPYAVLEMGRDSPDWLDRVLDDVDRVLNPG